MKEEGIKKYNICGKNQMREGQCIPDVLVRAEARCFIFMTF